MCKSLFVSVILMSFAVHTNADTRGKQEALATLLDETYPDVAVFNDSIKESKENLKKQLQSFFLTCLLSAEKETTAEDTSAFLNAVSCHVLIEKTNTSASGLTRFQMKQTILTLGETKKINEARQEALLASLDQIYGLESSQKAQEREQLVSHFQNCEQDFGVADKLQFWNDAFGCKGIIETAKEAGIAYFTIQDAIEAAFSEETVAQVEVVDVLSTEPKKKQRTSKP